MYLNNKIFKIMKSLIVLLFVMLQTNCSKSNSDEPVVNPPITNPQTGVSDVDFWLTQGNQSVKLAKQNTFLKFGNTSNNSQTITVEESQTFQTIDGFGYSLTGGSTQLINQLNASKKDEFYTQLSDIDRELKHYKNPSRTKLFCVIVMIQELVIFFTFFRTTLKSLGLKS